MGANPVTDEVEYLLKSRAGGSTEHHTSRTSESRADCCACQARHRVGGYVLGSLREGRPIGRVR